MPKNNRHGRAAIFTDSDYVKILKALDNPKHRIFFQIAWWSGERWGAICKLDVDDVYRDPKKRIPQKDITFKAATRKGSPQGQRTTRQVPIHPSLKEALSAYDPPIEGWLFPGKSPGKPMIFRNSDRFLRLALERANLDGLGYSTHSTRRTFITRLNNAGTALPVIQSLTGHADLQTLQLYIEVSDEQRENAIARL